MKIKAYKINAFTEKTNGGNPAGVVPNPPGGIKKDQMTLISRKLGVSETAFVFPSEKADCKTRFFSPRAEVALCGHATIATFYMMGQKTPGAGEKVFYQETQVGVLPVSVIYKNKKISQVMMTQDHPTIKNISLDISSVADVLRINVEDIDTSLPSQVVSTGLYTLPICVKSLDVLKNITPNYEGVEGICKKINAGSV